MGIVPGYHGPVYRIMGTLSQRRSLLGNRKRLHQCSSQPDGTSILKYYSTSSAFRVQLDDTKVFIVDYNAMQLYSLTPKRKPLLSTI